MEKIVLDEEGRYQEIILLGSGGTSNVYGAQDTRLHKKVVMKAIQNHEIAMQEAKMLRGLDDRRIPYLIDCYEYNNQMILVMQYIEGMTMTEYFMKYKEITEREIYDYLMELISILQYLHHQKNPIIYLDLKPDNIMIGSEGQIYLIDFGAARYQYYEESQVDFYGTVNFAPKELIECQQDDSVVDVRCDIYSLGMVAIYMRTGVREDDIANEMIRKHLREYVISRKFEKVVLKCVQDEVENRYQTLKEVEYHMKQVQLVKSLDQIVTFFIRGIYMIAIVAVAVYVGVLVGDMNLLELENYNMEIKLIIKQILYLLAYHKIIIQRLRKRRKPYRQINHMMLIGKKGVIL